MCLENKLFGQYSRKTLSYLAWGMPPEQRYRVSTIPKRDGTPRVIAAPCKELKAVQRFIYKLLQAYYNPPKCVHGFIPERSIRTNAEAHLRSGVILKVDIKDFFDSINFGRVLGLLKSLKIEPKVATLLAQICCHDGHLPQGAPTSPLLSNMIALSMDKNIIDICKSNNCFYTRYSDDITISKRDNKLPKALGYTDNNGMATCGTILEQAIIKAGFYINAEKTKIVTRDTRQSVTGIVVNKYLNVNKHYIKTTRAMVHSYISNPDDVFLRKFYHSDEQVTNKETAKSSIIGRIEHIGNITGYRRKSIMDLRKTMTGSSIPTKQMKLYRNTPLAVYLRDNGIKVFISFPSKDENALGCATGLKERLTASGIESFFSAVDIGTGDWRKTITDALKRSNCIITVETREYFESDNCLLELVYSCICGYYVFRCGITPYDDIKQYQADCLASIQHNNYHYGGKPQYEKIFSTGKLGRFTKEQQELALEPLISILGESEIRGLANKLGLSGELPSSASPNVLQNTFCAILAQRVEKYPSFGRSYPLGEKFKSV